MRLRRAESAVAASQRHGTQIEGILAGVERVISDTGDRAFAAASVDPISRAVQAWGAGGADIGVLAAKLRDLGVDPTRGLDILGAIGGRVRSTIGLEGGKSCCATSRSVSSSGRWCSPSASPRAI